MPSKRICKKKGEGLGEVEGPRLSGFRCGGNLRQTTMEAPRKRHGAKVRPKKLLCVGFHQNVTQGTD